MKVRIRFSKLGKVRWISHRDVARVWERAFRRAGLPVAYTEGFSPHPRVSFGLALPTGYESVAEYLDVDLAEAVDVTHLPARLSPALPAGIDVLAAAPVDDHAPSLQHEVTSCAWDIPLEAPPADLASRVAGLLAADEVVVERERKGRKVTDDIRPALLSLTFDHDGRLGCELATQPRGLRPAELLAALGVDAVGQRTHQWTSRDGARREPLPLAAPDAPHAQLDIVAERAS